jgi:hypothetical protein
MAGYGTDADFTAWLAENGLTVPVGSVSAVLRQRGSAYLDGAYGSRLTCSYPTGGVQQERAFPRTGLPFVPSDAIPRAWVQASYRAAYLIANDAGALSATINPNARVTKEKVDVIEVAYADNGAVVAGEALGVLDAEIDGMVAPYLCKTDYQIGIMAV